MFGAGRILLIRYTGTMASINQIQMNYSPQEDRVLLRLNTSGNEEFRFWVTRRYAVLLGQVLALHRQSDPDVARQAPGEDRQTVEAFKREAADANANFNDGFQGASQFPLGEHPLLAFKIDYKVVEGKLVLTISPESGQGITITLDQQLNFNVGRLLKSAAEKAGWGIDLDALPQNQEIPAASQVVN